MRRSCRHATLALLGALALSCQSYSFNPVSRCLIQPGTQRVAVSDVSSADVLFVVDDSGSMAGEQTNLALAFDEFIGSLSGYNDRRVENGLEPFDFHIAITSTSVFLNRGASGIQDRYVFNREPKACTQDSQCSGDAPYTKCVEPPTGERGCGGYTGDMCCTPPKSCTAATQGTDCDAGYVCGSCAGQNNVCCWGQSPTHPQGSPKLIRACDPGIAADKEGKLYPRGDFLGLGENPRVLHYDKSLFGRLVGGAWQPVDPDTARNDQGFTRQDLKDFFAENVKVGTCGSGQEQGLQAARLAVTKALAGNQYDRRSGSGAIVSEGTVKAAWPHSGAKLVVVYVGDEDDCSAPEDPTRGVVLTGLAGSDSCVADSALPPDQQKQFRVEDVVRDLTGLGRPVGAAFVVSTQRTTCVDEACTAGICCDHQCTGSNAACSDKTCGGQGAGKRFLQAAGVLRSAGADVVAASICDPGATACSTDADCAALPGSACWQGCGGAVGKFCCHTGGPLQGTLAGSTGFAPILARIAEIVKPPSALMLPTQPADAAVTRLRIVSPDGATRKICNGPAPAMTFAQALAQGWDWWFTASREQITDADKAASSTSRYVYINHATSNCVPNPGDEYVADYLGMVPAGGCLVDADCKGALGGCTCLPGGGDDCSSGQAKWTCFAGFAEDGACRNPTAEAPGTCVCGLRTDREAPEQSVCPNG